MQILTFTPDATNSVSFDNFVSDQWIIGEGADSITEYIMHLAEPVFVAKFWDGNECEEVPPNTTSGFSVAIGDCVFYDIIWFDDLPSNEEIIALFQEADDAITRISFREEFY